MTESHIKTEEEHAASACYPIVELRQYTLKPNRRDDLITLFEQHFVEGQEQYGMQILGQFRNHTNPDLFVWLRSFPDMEARLQALQGFYYGPIWQAHRDAANDTMIDVSNVFLLKPVSDTSSLRYNPSERPAKNAEDMAGGFFIATIYHFDTPPDTSFVTFFETKIAPVLNAAGATLLGHYVTEPAENTFPRLPVREGEHVFVWFASLADEDAYAAYRKALTSDEKWTTMLASALQKRISRPAEVLELIPTRRSLLRHHMAGASPNDH